MMDWTDDLSPLRLPKKRILDRYATEFASALHVFGEERAAPRIGGSLNNQCVAKRKRAATSQPPKPW